MRIKMKEKHSAESHCECSVSDKTLLGHTHTHRQDGVMQRDLTGAEGPAAWQTQEVGSCPSREANLGESVLSHARPCGIQTVGSSWAPGHLVDLRELPAQARRPQPSLPAGCV